MSQCKTTTLSINVVIQYNEKNFTRENSYTLFSLISSLFMMIKNFNDGSIFIRQIKTKSKFQM